MKMETSRVFFYDKNGCYCYLPRKCYERNYTVRTEGIQLALYFIMSALSRQYRFYVVIISHRVVYALFCYTCFIIISYSSWYPFVFISLSYNACRTLFHLHAEPHLF